MNHDVEIGYCGNVHPAISVDQLIHNLIQHTAAVRADLKPNGTMPFGIWLSSQAVDELMSPRKLLDLQATLADHSLIPMTVNGFPFGDFHQRVVKDSVYLPDWTDPKRLDYTLRLADLHHQLLPPDAVSTISTLPLGWPGHQKPTSDFLNRCADHLRSCATQLDRRYQKTGRFHMVCIEPEPGCILDSSGDVVDFFKRYLRPSEFPLVAKHIGVCHDVCHSAVMFETQQDAIAAYADNGIAVGKIQISSAVEVNFDALDGLQKTLALDRLKTFNEPKYLHQTHIRSREGHSRLYEDLPAALASCNGGSPQGIWRIHFHVPIFFSGDGIINTTQNCIAECLSAVDRFGVVVAHLEVETYAWTVMPPGIFDGSLNEGIAKEIRWFKELNLPQ